MATEQTCGGELRNDEKSTINSSMHDFELITFLFHVISYGLFLRTVYHFPP